jgi:DNA-binding beta-propeller fold protein YncE
MRAVVLADPTVACLIKPMVRKIDIATAAVTTLAGLAGESGSADGSASAARARFYYPAGVASDKAGNLFVADASNHTIRRIVVASQVVSTVVGAASRQGVLLGSLPGELDGAPAGLAFGASGQLFITEQHQNAVLVAKF